MSTFRSLLFPPKLLVVEDDREIRAGCVTGLRNAGYRVIEAADGIEALEKLKQESPAVVILDVVMPRMDGFEVLRRMRERGSHVMVLILTAHDRLDIRIKAFSSGADDYLAKPFHFSELIARIEALLRRSFPRLIGPPTLVVGDTTVDLRNRTAARAGEQLSLTKVEYALLELLARNGGRPVSKETILDAVWGYAPHANTRTLETHVWRLRQKLGDTAPEPHWILTVPGRGYQLACGLRSDGSAPAGDPTGQGSESPGAE